MGKKRPVVKIGAFCWLSFAQEQRKVLKEKPDGSLKVEFSLYARLELPVMFLLQAFTIT